jgi:N-acylneuraminate cytidylyltransferase
MNICIIPARGGSRRIPHKNRKLFHGRPIIAYSIEKAREVGLFERIIVSTDSDDIAEVASLYGAEVWRRDPAFGHNDVGTQAVVKECIIGIGGIASYDCVCCIYATAPLMDIKDLRAGYQLLNHAHADYVFSVGDSPLQDAGQFYWGAAYHFMKGTPLISEYTRMVVIDPSRVCDINTMKDWKRALKMYEDLK